MKPTITATTGVLLAVLSAFAHGGRTDLSLEHKGAVFSSLHVGPWYGEHMLNNGTPVGETVQLGGESVYLSYPPNNSTEYTVMYFTDIFGNKLVNNLLLADNIARAGYFVVMPDYFRGDGAPADGLTDPSLGFNLTAWSARHEVPQIEAIINSTIAAVQSEFNISHLGAVGYCFGGRYVARYLAEGRAIEAGFTAHPSDVTADDWSGIANPISIAFGAIDPLNTPENRTNIEKIFQDGNKTFQTSLYADAEHSFAVRTNLSNPLKAFAQRSAYVQAVRWLDAWL